MSKRFALRSQMIKRLMTACFILALIAALGYFLLGAGLIEAGNLGIENAPPAIAWVAGACYIVGGLLILLKKRWLWIIGAVINVLVIVFFYTRYVSNPGVIVSAPGLITKIAQILLEAGLIYLILKFKKTAPAK
jgi:hypothetical protein